jgi:tetratricopeptide (TPR) repeat protein
MTRVADDSKCKMQNAKCKIYFALCILTFAFFLPGCGQPAAHKELLTEPPAANVDQLDPPVRKAIEEAQAAVRAEPKSAAAWGQLGKLLLAHEVGIEPALICLGQAELRQPGSPEWPYLQGVWLARSDPEPAISKLRRAVELGGEEELVARMRLAETLAAEEQIDAAEQEANYVLARSPASSRARLLLGRLWLKSGKFPEARETLEKVRTDPRAQPAALALLAEVYERLGETDEARRAAQAAGVNPAAHGAVAWPDKFADEVIQLRRGRRAELAVADGLLAQNRPHESLAALKATLQQYPELGWAWLLSGRAHLALKDAAKAEADLRRSIDLLPESVESHFYLGAALVAQERILEASAAFRRATEITPDFALAHYYLAECQSKLGETDGAVSSLRRAVAAKPDLAAGHLFLARLLHQRGEKAEAISHVQATLKLQPTNAQARRLLDEIRQDEAEPKQN